MREAIHPGYHKVGAVCVCGGVIETGSTLAEIRLDICSNCHPFYTGTQKIVDTEGRVDKFKKRYANANQQGGSKKGKKDQQQGQQQEAEQEQA
jgi:large subunit ribosomal protein L31